MTTGIDADQSFKPGSAYRFEATDTQKMASMISAQKTIDAKIKVDEGLWRSAILPEGVLDRWLAEDGVDVPLGHAVAVVGIEDAKHDLIAPVAGRLQILAHANAVILPGELVGRIVAAAAGG